MAENDVTRFSKLAIQRDGFNPDNDARDRGFCEAVYTMLANGSLADQVFFSANRSWAISSVVEAHGTAGSDAGAVTIDVKKLTTGQNIAAGTSILGATFNAKGTADTPVIKTQAAGALGAAAALELIPGDRLAVDFGGTLTALAGVTVSVLLRPV